MYVEEIYRAILKRKHISRDIKVPDLTRLVGFTLLSPTWSNKILFRIIVFKAYLKVGILNLFKFHFQLKCLGWRRSFRNVLNRPTKWRFVYPDIVIFVTMRADWKLAKKKMSSPKIPNKSELIWVFFATIFDGFYFFNPTIKRDFIHLKRSFNVLKNRSGHGSDKTLFGRYCKIFCPAQFISTWLA